MKSSGFQGMTVGVIWVQPPYNLQSVECGRPRPLQQQQQTAAADSSSRQ